MNIFSNVFELGKHSVGHFLLEKKAFTWLGAFLGAFYNVQRQMPYGFPPNNFKVVNITMHSMVYASSDGPDLLNSSGIQQQLLWLPVLIAFLVGGLIGFALNLIITTFWHKRSQAKL